VPFNLPSRKIDRFLRGLAIVSVFAIAATAYIDWQAFRAETRHAEQTRQILLSTERVLSALKDAEIGQRGYLLTGDPQYVQPYNSARDAFPLLLQTLSEAAALRPIQADRAVLIRTLIEEKLAEISQTLTVRRDEGAEAALAIVKTNKGQALMDKVRSLVEEMNEAEYSDLVEHSRQAQRYGSRSRIVVILGSLILFVLLVSSEKAVSRVVESREGLLRELDESRQWFQTTLTGLGDAVIATDRRGIVTFTNPVAQALTGWGQDEAIGKPLDDIFRIVNETTRVPVESPGARVLREGTVVGLANHTVLLTKSGNSR
jgi:PAS domain S-box-containing protein